MATKKPSLLFQLDTDDEEKVAKFIKKMEAKLKEGGTIYIPKGVRVFDYSKSKFVKPKRWWEFWK